jgi:ferritin
MLKWFVDEQLEEEDNTGGIVRKLEFLGGDKHGIYTVDRELSSR